MTYERWPSSRPTSPRASPATSPAPRSLPPSRSPLPATSPKRVELASYPSSKPGFVILADTYYPGWTLTIDGHPAPIYRTNRLMRGAAVKEGRHTLVYTYDPNSFHVGATMSIAGVLTLAALVPWAMRGPIRSEVPVWEATGDQRVSGWPRS